MPTRFVTYTAFGRAVRHPLLAVSWLTVLIAFIISLFFYFFERETSPDYGNYFTALRNIVILVLSGYEIDQPESYVALACSYLLVVLGIVYVAVFTAVVAAEFVDVKIRRGVTVRPVTFKNHTLLCGWVNRSRRILEQLFSPDLKEHYPVVIIDPDIEETPMDSPLVKVVRGDPTDTATLDKANAQHARAAIVLANRDLGDPNAADARSLLIVLAMETLQPEIYSCVEVLNPENLVHFRRVNVDEAVSVSEISDALVIQAALHPGVSKLLASMVTFGEGEELYELPVPSSFVGRTFTELSSVLMEELGIVLIGVSSNGEVINSHRSRWRFQEKDAVFVLAEESPKSLEDLEPKQAVGP